jgi:23S rRNA (pseudouridine1915-N3)-methyltransferase
VKIIIHTIGKNSATQLQSLIKEYLKRLPWSVEIKTHDPKAKGDIKSIKEKEGEVVLKYLQKDSYKIALDEKGALLNSHEFASLIQKQQNFGKNKMEFLIGGAYGHSQTLKNACDMVLSLSKMTFAHQLVPVILAEQIYRAYTIINNHPYHKS